MEQRPLRLGDLVDDYCPRERRITNHAIVAIVNEAIRQTRCIACDTEHVFKGAKPPRRRLVKPDAGVVEAGIEVTDVEIAMVEVTSMAEPSNVQIPEPLAASAAEPQSESATDDDSAGQP